MMTKNLLVMKIYKFIPSNNYIINDYLINYLIDN